MQTLSVFFFVAAAFAADDGHDHGADGHEKQECSCAQHETDHPFVIDCDDDATIRKATSTLETTCKEAQSYEWGGAFKTPGTAYKWVAQAVDGAYADPAMKLVVFDLHAADSEHLLEKQAAAAALMAGTSCTVVNNLGSIPAPTDAGACYTLTFPTDPATDFTATVDTTGVTNVAFFGEHVPTEFERDIHYFMSTDLGTDIEPMAQTDALEYNCKLYEDSDGIKVCAQAFYIIQAHHDYCPHDTLTRYEEELFHEWESKCFGCSIVRKYDSTLKTCPVVDCSDVSVAKLGYEYLHQNCDKADTTYPFEWAAVFDTPGTDYTWVSQAATVAGDFEWAGAFATPASAYKWVAQAVEGNYTDPAMKLVVFALDAADTDTLASKRIAANTLMAGTCTVVNTLGNIPVPTATGACYTLTFPSNVATDFTATVDTTGVANVGFFAEHVPTEFEDDIHYFMSTDLGTDIEPAAETPFTCVKGSTTFPCSYADAEMMLVAFAMPDSTKASLYGMKDAADTLMTTAGSCPEVTASCTPGSTTCTPMPAIVPSASGACVTIKFPTDASKDFMMKVDTTGVSNTAFFTAHVPTEFEFDTHYFMSTDLGTDIEPVNNLGAAATHEHRRLSEVNGKPMNDRRSKRRLANKGACCRNEMENGAWKQVVAYHDLCDYHEVPPYIEIGFHDYEASCEDHFCNLIGPGIDQTICPYAPPSPPAAPPTVLEKSTGIKQPVLIAVIIAGVLAVGLALMCICYMITKEKAGKPVFTNLVQPKGGAAA